jgi:hypothetical protein
MADHRKGGLHHAYSNAEFDANRIGTGYTLSESDSRVYQTSNGNWRMAAVSDGYSMGRTRWAARLTSWSLPHQHCSYWGWNYGHCSHYYAVGVIRTHDEHGNDLNCNYNGNAESSNCKYVYYSQQGFGKSSAGNDGCGENNHQCQYYRHYAGSNYGWWDDSDEIDVELDMDRNRVTFERRYGTTSNFERESNYQLDSGSWRMFVSQSRTGYFTVRHREPS